MCLRKTLDPRLVEDEVMRPPLPSMLVPLGCHTGEAPNEINHLLYVSAVLVFLRDFRLTTDFAGSRVCFSYGLSSG